PGGRPAERHDGRVRDAARRRRGGRGAADGGGGDRDRRRRVSRRLARRAALLLRRQRALELRGRRAARGGLRPGGAAGGLPRAGGGLMRFGYWLPVFGGWLRDDRDESMEATWGSVLELERGR